VAVSPLLTSATIEALGRYADLRPKWRDVYTGLVRLSQTGGGLMRYQRWGAIAARSDVGPQRRPGRPFPDLPRAGLWAQPLEAAGIDLASVTDVVPPKSLDCVWKEKI
jgi:hypothetical protein